MEKIDFTRVNNDTNGNPRYVCHFLNFINDKDDEQIRIIASCNLDSISASYKLALMRAKTIGGKKFHNKQYGGGIVFQSYNIYDLSKRILELKNI